MGPLMNGLLETLGLTVAGHLEHGQVKVVPEAVGRLEEHSLKAIGRQEGGRRKV